MQIRSKVIWPIAQLTNIYYSLTTYKHITSLCPITNIYQLYELKFNHEHYLVMLIIWKSAYLKNVYLLFGTKPSIWLNQTWFDRDIGLVCICHWCGLQSWSACHVGMSNHSTLMSIIGPTECFKFAMFRDIN